jgi:arylsulfatase A-like enzyme
VQREEKRHARLRSALEIFLLGPVAVGLVEGALLIREKAVPGSSRGTILLTSGLTFPLLALPQALLIYALLGLLARAPGCGGLRRPGFRVGFSLTAACLALPLAAEWNSRHPGFSLTATYLVPYGIVLAGSLVAAIAAGLAAERLRRSAATALRLRRSLRWAVAAALLASGAHHVLMRADPAANAPLLDAAGGGLPNIVLVSVDTLRRDRLGSYGYPKPTDPEIQRAFADGLRYEDAVCPVAVTRPSHASMLTGAHVLELGMRWNGRPLAEGFPTLAEILGRNGYDTAAFVSGWPLFGARSGLDRGFRRYSDEFNPFLSAHHGAEHLTLPETLRIFGAIDTLCRDAGAVTDAALAWLAETTHRPFFVWIHYYDPHSHYTPPVEHARAMGLPDDGPRTTRWLYSRVESGDRALSERERGFVDALYDGEVRYVDSQLGRFFEALRGAGLWDDTVVLLTADHGEILLERLASDGKAFIHSAWVDEEEIRIPFLIRGPGVPRGVRSGHTASAGDILPTLLGLAGIEGPAGITGRDLLGDDPAELALRPVISINAPPKDGPTLITARAEGFRYTLELESGSESLAPIEGGPNGGTRDAAAPRELAERLRASVQGLPIVQRRIELDADEEQKLRALGYIE